MNYEYYETLVTLAQTRNFSTTAKMLNVVQSTVSNRIKELENYHNQTLFKRTNKSVELTPAGDLLLPYAKRLITLENEAQTVLNNITFSKKIRIGSVHSVYRGFLKDRIKSYIQLNSDIAVKILINHSDKLIEMLSDDLIDMALVSYVPRSNQFESLLELNDPIILISKKCDTVNSSISTNELKTLKMVAGDMSLGFNEWYKKLIGQDMQSQIYIDQIYEVFDYVVEGMGHAFVLKSMAQSFIRSGMIKEIKIQDVKLYEQKNYLITNKSNSGSVYHFADYLKQ